MQFKACLVYLDAHEMLRGCVFVLADYPERLPEETLKIWVEVSMINN